MDECHKVEPTGKTQCSHSQYIIPTAQQASYSKAHTLDWKIDNNIVGQVRSGGGLTFAAVEAAGHMVPMDQPQTVSLHNNKKSLLKLCCFYFY